MASNQPPRQKVDNRDSQYRSLIGIIVGPKTHIIGNNRKHPLHVVIRNPCVQLTKNTPSITSPMYLLNCRPTRTTVWLTTACLSRLNHYIPQHHATQRAPSDMRRCQRRLECELCCMFAGWKRSLTSKTTFVECFGVRRSCWPCTMYLIHVP